MTEKEDLEKAIKATPEWRKEVQAKFAALDERTERLDDLEKQLSQVKDLDAADKELTKALEQIQESVDEKLTDYDVVKEAVAELKAWREAAEKEKEVEIEEPREEEIPKEEPPGEEKEEPEVIRITLAKGVE